MPGTSWPRPAWKIARRSSLTRSLRSAEGLAGKPSPDTFLHAARLLSLEPAQCAVVEDAISGVEAGKAGGFGAVIGVARHGDSDFFAAGADRVVGNLAELIGDLV